MNEITEFTSTIFEMNIFEDEKKYFFDVEYTKMCTVLKCSDCTLQKFKELFQESTRSIKDILKCRLFYGNSLLHYTSRASVAQLVRARDCQCLGRRFDSG